MGLGKTVQCVSMLGYLRDVLRVGGPFLVVVPLSTVPNWIRELRKWLPSANSVVYVGDTKSRHVIREYEWGAGSTGRGARAAFAPPRTTAFDVLVTTYELVLKDAAHLASIRWNYLVVDEAHRLKNNNAALYRGLDAMTFRNKLLVTGTPLQNSLKELWALLHFLDPVKFGDADAFTAEYEVREAEQVMKLHAELKPHLLRRVIKDVEKSLPPKNERILRVGMTPLQKQYYKWILSRNFKELNRGTRGSAQVRWEREGGDCFFFGLVSINRPSPPPPFPSPFSSRSPCSTSSPSSKRRATTRSCSSRRKPSTASSRATRARAARPPRARRRRPTASC